MSEMKVRAKFRCDRITHSHAGKNYKQADIELNAVTDASEEDKAFWKATPVGSIKLQTVNPEAAQQFEPGETYYVDFTRAD